MAAEKKRAARADRVKWWRDKKTEVMTEVRESGIEVRESLADASPSYSNKFSTVSAVGPQVVVRTDLQAKLNECYSKITWHANAMREYHGWAQVLAANPETRVKLNHDDWLYFFGAETKEELEGTSDA